MKNLLNAMLCVLLGCSQTATNIKTSPMKAPVQMNETFAKIESFTDVLTQKFPVGTGLDGYEFNSMVSSREFRPISEAEVLELEAQVGELPTDYRSALLRGFRFPGGTIQDDAAARGESSDRFSTIGLEFVSAKIILRDIADFRNLGPSYADGNLRWVFENGFPITWGDPQLVLTSKGVHYVVYDGEFSPEPVATSFAEFMDLWFESGCFGSHSFDYYQQNAGTALQPTIPFEKNAWLQTLGEAPSSDSGQN